MMTWIIRQGQVVLFGISLFCLSDGFIIFALSKRPSDYFFSSRDAKETDGGMQSCCVHEEGPLSTEEMSRLRVSCFYIQFHNCTISDVLLFRSVLFFKMKKERRPNI